MSHLDALGAGVLLVSIPKAGTHLVTKLFEQLRYYAEGWAAQSSDAEIQYEAFVARTAGMASFAALRERFPTYDADALWTLVYRYLRRNAGDVAFTNFMYPDDLVANRVLDHVERMEDVFPRGYLLSLHELEWSRASLRVLDALRPDATPRLVFVYRDPRDQMLSMLRFIETSPMMDDHPIGRIYRPILRACSSLTQRVELALYDHGFPFREAYRKNRWLLQHPHVCNVRYEDLVGASGGGDDERQRISVERLLRHVGVEAAASDVATRLYGGTKTFARGQTEDFRSVLGSELLAAFEREFADVLEAYGYA